MKKLMTMLAAVATAFGLFAAGEGDAGFLAGADFETETKAPAQGTLTWTSAGFATGHWTGETAATVVEGATGAESLPAIFSGSDDTQVLKIASTLGNPVAQYINSDKTGTSIGDGLYFDGLVNFTVFDKDDEVPAADLENAKIGVYLQLIGEDESAGTNLVVVAAATTAQADGKFVCTVTGGIAPGWHRLTIKSIKSITGADGGNVGFVVFVDGKKVTCDNAKLSEVSLAAKVVGYNDAGALFVSKQGNVAEISAVEFDGQGLVDDISFTTTAPDFAVDPSVATVGWDTMKVAGISLTEGGDLITVNPSIINMADIQDGKVYYKAAEGFVDGFIEVADGDNTTIGTDVTAAEASFAGKGYETLVGAVAAANAAEATDVLKLYATANAIQINNAKSVALTLDLNGNDVNGLQLRSNALTINNTGAAATINGVTTLADTTLTLNAGKYNVISGVQGTLVIPANSTAEFFNEVGGGDTSLAIATDADLIKLAKVTKAGYATDGKIFKQTADITLTAAFDGIGARDMKNTLSSSLANYTSANVFKGTYDGGDFTVSGVILKTGDYIGFFNSTYGATIKNLKISLGNATGWSDTTSDQVGAVFVGVSVNTTIQDCQTLVAGEEGAYNTFKATKTAAGIVGFAANGTVIKGCVNNLNIWSAANVKGGGLIACAQAGKSSGEGVEIEGCSNNGNVKSAASSSEPYCAGLVGYADLKITLKGENSVGKDVVLESTSATPGTPKSLIHVSSGSVVVDDGATFTVPAGYMTCNKVYDGLNFATVVNGVATLVKNADVSLNGSYKVMAPGAAYEFTKEGSITFDNSLVPTFVPTADETQFDLSNVGYVWTCSEKPATVDFSVKAGENSSIKEVEINGEVVVGELPVKLNENDTYKVTFEPTAGYAFADGEDGIRSGKAEKDAINVIGPNASLIPVTSVTLDFTELTMNITDVSNLVATVAPATVLNNKVDWSVEGDAVTVEGGVVTAVKAGTATVKAASNADPTKYATCEVTVAAPGPIYPKDLPDDPTVKGKYADWAKGKDISNPDDPVVMEAFLLNCALNEVETEKAKFKITSITQDAEGNWIVKVTGEKGEGDEYGNGYVEIVPYEGIDVGDNGELFQAKLVLQPPTKGE